MPYQEDHEITKRYYTMGEVSELFGVNASQVRFYEKEFEILQPKKNKKGNRLFTAEDLENLKIIFHLVKEKGFTLRGWSLHWDPLRASFSLGVDFYFFSFACFSFLKHSAEMLSATEILLRVQ